MNVSPSLFSRHIVKRKKLFSNINRKKKKIQNRVSYNFRLVHIFFVFLSPSLFYFFSLDTIMEPEDKDRDDRNVFLQLDNRVSLQMQEQRKQKFSTRGIFFFLRYSF